MAKDRSILCRGFAILYFEPRKVASLIVTASNLAHGDRLTSPTSGALRAGLVLDQGTHRFLHVEIGSSSVQGLGMAWRAYTKQRHSPARFLLAAYALLGLEAKHVGSYQKQRSRDHDFTRLRVGDRGRGKRGVLA